MVLILLIVVLTALKFFEVSFMANISWWWLIGLFAIAFVWFEFFERLFGLDKKNLDADFDETKKNRAKQTFEKK